MSKPLVAAAALVLTALPALAEGFLVGRPQRAPDIELALGDAGYGIKQDPFTFETGKGYRMWIKSTGKKPCAFEADDFFKNVWFRKIEINKVEVKLQSLQEIEFEDEGAAELFFTPVKPGEYVWHCKGLADKGMTGKLTVK